MDMQKKCLYPKPVCFVQKKFNLFLYYSFHFVFIIYKYIFSFPFSAHCLSFVVSFFSPQLQCKKKRKKNGQFLLVHNMYIVGLVLTRLISILNLYMMNKFSLITLKFDQFPLEIIASIN